MDGLYWLICFINNYCCVCEVVCINLMKLKDFKDVIIINLNDKDVREEYIDCYFNVWGYVYNFEEVVLVLKLYILVECFERIGIVKDK